MDVLGRVFTRLIYRRIDADIGSQFICRTETRYVADLTDNGCTEKWPDTWYRSNGAVELFEQFLNFLFQLIGRFSERLELIQHRFNQCGVCILAIFDTKTIACKCF